MDKHTSNAASKDNANDASIVGDFSADQQPQMEPKTMPQHEKDRPDPSPKSPGAKSTIKALKQANRGAVQAKQSADVSQEDEQPVSRKSPSAEIIPESLEPSQPITAGHAKGQQRSRHTASTGTPSPPNSPGCTQVMHVLVPDVGGNSTRPGLDCLQPSPLCIRAFLLVKSLPRKIFP